ncbi:hypothetical protein [Acinetobacter sp. ANC 4178]|nr:hypothetical protein [Acinetobacter sp. ANC 4178]
MAQSFVVTSDFLSLQTRIAFATDLHWGCGITSMALDTASSLG